MREGERGSGDEEDCGETEKPVEKGLRSLREGERKLSLSPSPSPLPQSPFSSPASFTFHLPNVSPSISSSLSFLSLSFSPSCVISPIFCVLRLLSEGAGKSPRSPISLSLSLSLSHTHTHTHTHTHEAPVGVVQHTPHPGRERERRERESCGEACIHHSCCGESCIHHFS